MSRLPEDKNSMGVFICDAITDNLRENLCLVNPGMIRIDFRTGNLTYDLIF